MEIIILILLLVNILLTILLIRLIYVFAVGIKQEYIQIEQYNKDVITAFRKRTKREISRFFREIGFNACATPDVRYSYSWDREDFHNGLYRSVEDAIRAAKKANPDAKDVYVGRMMQPKLKWGFQVEKIVESINRNLEQECGYVPHCGITDDRVGELSRMIDETVEDWIYEYEIKPNCYSCVEFELHSLAKGEDGQMS